MPLKKRSFRRDIGDVADGAYSDEIDMSNATKGVLYVTPTGAGYTSAFKIEVYASPQDFGTTPSWYRLWCVRYNLFATPTEQPTVNDIDVGYNTNLENNGGPQAIPFPLPYRLYDATRAHSSEGMTPRRVRFKPVGCDVSLEIEGMRSVA